MSVRLFVFTSSLVLSLAARADAQTAPPCTPVSTPVALRASAYVEDARSGFCRAGSIQLGGLTVRAPVLGKRGREANSTGFTIGGYGEDAFGPHGDWEPRPAGGGLRTLPQLQEALMGALDEVFAALASGAPIPRRTIYVADEVDLDLGTQTLRIPPGVTLASGRGRGFPTRSLGAILRSSSDTNGVSIVVLPQGDFETTRPLPPVRITGLRLIGPNPYVSPPGWSCDDMGRTGMAAFSATTRRSVQMPLMNSQRSRVKRAASRSSVGVGCSGYVSTHEPSEVSQGRLGSGARLTFSAVARPARLSG